MFSPSLGFESTIDIDQQFQGTVLPTATGNSHTVHHHASPQTWHHAVTPQNFSGHNLPSNDIWYGGSPLEGFGTLDTENEVTEQDLNVTSTTEVSPWIPLPPVSDFLNPSPNTNFKWRISPVEVSTRKTCQLDLRPSATIEIKPRKPITKARTQTAWKLKKEKCVPEAKPQSKRKGKPRKLADPLTCMKQKTVQKERERKTKNEPGHLSTMLTCTDQKSHHPSRKEIIENAITYIMQLQKDIREAVVDLKAILQSSEMLASQETTEMLSSRGSVEMEENSANTLQNGNIKTQISHVKRPMNAFLLYSQQNRKAFKELYPGKDNREITIILSEHWCSLKPELKEPYKDKARELMKITRESHPDFKYHKARKETGEALVHRDGDKQVSQDQGYRTATTGRRLEPAPKRIKREPGFRPNIKDAPASGMANQTGTTVAAAVEPYKLLLNVNQGESTCEDEDIQESCHGEPGVEVNREWQPRTSNTWVQCESCKKWQMLSVDSDPTILPNKWFCPLHVKCQSSWTIA